MLPELPYGWLRLHDRDVSDDLLTVCPGCLTPSEEPSFEIAAFAEYDDDES